MRSCCLGSGSSPHTRGAQITYICPPRSSRIIPAYAGSTTEYWCLGYAKYGSSPHTRGAPCVERWASRRKRIIPAYAGSTRQRLRQLVTDTDHPRIRGEHHPENPQPRRPCGSSPHTRGAHPLPRPARMGRGIIPAYAGSTSKRGVWPVGADGSSPHTRGARPVLCGVSGRAGIIPAYAGSTPRAGWRRCRRSDHPRIRGEHRQWRSE